MLEVIEGKPPLPALVPALRARAVRHRHRRRAGRQAARSEPRHRRAEPDARQQRRDAVERAAHPRPRRRLVPVDGHAGVAGHRRRHRRRRRRRARRRRDRARHAAAGGDRRRRQRRPRRAAPSRRCSRASPTRSSPPTNSTCRSATKGSTRSAAGWAPPDSSSTTTRRAWSTPPTGSRASSTSSRAASARRARSARARSPTMLERIETGAGDDTDLADIGGWLERVTDGNRCYLAVEERLVVSSILRAFPEEFVDHIEHHRCPRPGTPPDPEARSTSPTARRPTTSASGGSDPTGPTSRNSGFPARACSLRGQRPRGDASNLAMSSGVPCTTTCVRSVGRPKAISVISDGSPTTCTRARPSSRRRRGGRRHAGRHPRNTAGTSSCRPCSSAPPRARLHDVGRSDVASNRVEPCGRPRGGRRARTC